MDLQACFLCRTTWWDGQLYEVQPAPSTAANHWKHFLSSVKEYFKADHVWTLQTKDFNNRTRRKFKSNLLNLKSWYFQFTESRGQSDELKL